MRTREWNHLAALILVGLAIAGLACEQVNSPLAPAPATVGSSQVLGGESALNQQLAQLQRVTARFHDINKAKAAGYSTKVTECVALEGVGAQGFHYGNTALIDGTVTLFEPELLLYEPRGHQTLSLVGIEYIVPFGAWSAASPPTLLGETFHRNEALGLWALHVWIWKPNLSGMFADWNPNVSCEGA